MRRLVCAFDVRKQQSQGFSRRGPCDVEAQVSGPTPGYAPVKPPINVADVSCRVQGQHGRLRVTYAHMR